jgi:hypothetical protein
LSKNQEEDIINNVSSLLTSYFLSQQSEETSDNQEILDDDIRSISPVSDQSSPIMEINEFDKLLQRIKTVVDNNLSIKNHEKDPNSVQISTTTTKNRRPKMSKLRSTSSRESSVDDLDTNYSIKSSKKTKLNRSFKSQSFDETNLS